MCLLRGFWRSEIDGKSFRLLLEAVVKSYLGFSPKTDTDHS